MSVTSLPTVAQWYMITLLLLMSFGQFISWQEFVRAIAAFPVGMHAKKVAAFLIITQISGGLLLLPDDTRVAGAIIALVSALAWSALASAAFFQRRQLANCACFGRFLPQPLRWWVLAQDVAFVGLAVIVLIQAL